MKLILGFVFLGVLAVLAANKKEIWIFSGEQVDSTLKALRAGDKAKPSVSKTIGSFGNHSVMLVERNGNGVVEVHLHKNDVILVREGAGRLITGGEVIGGKNTEDGEIRGDSIKGGVEHTIRTGDIIEIPATVPHQVLLKPGETVSYAAIKVDAQ